ncbi:histidinol-phosphatase [Insolitispirillum peregrinum]|uniref:histidinol-phosphatase n=1 Tax=Insolitispirillum peregrinum TaxID=80876 RepID=UPI00360BFF52
MTQTVPSPTVPAAFVSLAHQLADTAGAVIRQYFRTPVAIDDKADESPVTIADRQAEQVMRDLVQANFPDHGIIGEEHGTLNGEAEWVWVFDPIDGTKAFITGKPSFGTLICLLHRGTPVLGVLDQPITRERWIGVDGQGTTLNGAPLRVRACDAVEKAALYSTDPSMFKGDAWPAYQRLAETVKLRRFGSDCYAYGLLAAGFVDLVCEADLKLYDFAALIPIIREAGGLVTDWQGQAPGIGSDGRILAAGDARCHAQALARLQDAG